MRQIDAGNPVPLPRILDVLGPNLLRGRRAANKPSAVYIFGQVPISAVIGEVSSGGVYCVPKTFPRIMERPGAARYRVPTPTPSEIRWCYLKRRVHEGYTESLRP
jgi:hypothetical protein